MKIIPDLTSHQYGYKKDYDVMLNKVVHLWVYDDMSSDIRSMLKMVETSAEGGKKGISNKVGRAGIMINGTSSKYVVRLGDVGGENTDISRSMGWHRFTWDYSNGSSAEIYIDGTHVGSHPANCFDVILIDNF